MVENLIELRKKLQHLAEQLELKRSLSIDACMSEEEYIENNIEVEKPKKRSVSNSEGVEIDYLTKKDQIDNAKMKSSIKYIAGLSVLIGEAVFFVISLIGGLGGLMGFLLTLPFLIISLSIYIDGKKTKKQIQDYFVSLEERRTHAKQIDKINELYNNNEYPKLLANYNAEVERLKPMYMKMQSEAQTKLDALILQMAGEEPVLAEKYHSYVNDIIEIIDDGRASSLAEAINVLIADQNAQRLINEQIRQNEIQAQAAEMQRKEAEAQRREMERHNRQMESAANEQLQMQKNKIDYAKCHNCDKEKYCYKQICTGYRPKRD